MKQSYEELQAQVQSLAVQRDGLIDELDKTQDEALDARTQRDALAAQVEVLRRELQSASDWFSAYWGNLNAEQRGRLKQIDSVAKSTPAACLAQVKAEDGTELADSLVDDFHDFCSGLDSMMVTLNSDEIADAIIGLVNMHAERIRQGGAE